MSSSSPCRWEKVWRALELAVAQGRDEDAEHAAQTLLQQVPREELVARLTPWAKGPDPEQRWWALRILAQVPHARSRVLLVQALEDQEPAVLMVAALGLRHQPDPAALPGLVRLLAHPDRLVAHLASDALAALGHQATPALMRVVEDGPAPARALAVRALARVRDRRAIPLLFRLLDDPSPLITQWAEEGLEALGVGTVFFWP